MFVQNKRHVNAVVNFDYNSNRDISEMPDSVVRFEECWRWPSVKDEFYEIRNLLYELSVHVIIDQINADCRGNVTLPAKYRGTCLHFPHHCITFMGTSLRYE